MIFDVADICHRIAYFKIYFVRAVEHTVEDGFEFGVNVCLFITHLGEEIPVFLCLKGTFIPGLCRVCLTARCSGDETEEEIE